MTIRSSCELLRDNTYHGHSSHTVWILQEPTKSTPLQTGRRHCGLSDIVQHARGAEASRRRTLAKHEDPPPVRRASHPGCWAGAPPLKSTPHLSTNSPLSPRAPQLLVCREHPPLLRLLGACPLRVHSRGRGSCGGTGTGRMWIRIRISALVARGVCPPLVWSTSATDARWLPCATATRILCQANNGGNFTPILIHCLRSLLLVALCLALSGGNTRSVAAHAVLALFVLRRRIQRLDRTASRTALCMRCCLLSIRRVHTTDRWSDVLRGSHCWRVSLGRSTRAQRAALSGLIHNEPVSMASRRSALLAARDGRSCCCVR